jgi:predicted MFS family arabinose efflux permease
MATAVAIAVANLYYCQPLLGAIARSFSLSQWQAARVPMLTQIGYAMGLGLFVPLGDLLERRTLICSLLFATAAALLGVALATNIIALLACSLLLGMFTAVLQIIVPMAASLAPTAQRGHAVGVLFSGITIGVLASRTISGFVGSYFGWRVVYAGASGAVALLAVPLRSSLPLDRRSAGTGYAELVKSVFVLVAQSAPLREAAFYGGCCFASLNAFWSTVVFFIGRPPYHYGERMAGALGLVGIGAVAIVPAVGRSADRRGPSFAIGMALIAGCSASLILLLWGQWMGGVDSGTHARDHGGKSESGLERGCDLRSVASGREPRQRCIHGCCLHRWRTWHPDRFLDLVRKELDRRFAYRRILLLSRPGCLHVPS